VSQERHSRRLLFTSSLNIDLLLIYRSNFWKPR